MYNIHIHEKHKIQGQFSQICVYASREKVININPALAKYMYNFNLFFLLLCSHKYINRTQPISSYSSFRKHIYCNRSICFSPTLERNTTVNCVFIAS